jgi:CubicO group peptidase (beta-lactamase class C family)
MSTQKVNFTIKRSLVKSAAMMMTLALLLSIFAPVPAQENKVASVKNVSIAPSQEQGPTDPAELEAFLDELLRKEMEGNHIAGAAVSVVKDGKLLFAKGYGYADVDRKIPVDSEHTLFRVGSVGKMFTWTAVMQLVEQGKLDLNADINTYLDFRIPDTYPQPITLKHLLAHTSGLEEVWFGSGVSDPNDLVPAREWLVSHMAARVHPPGDSAGYSNFNAVLAGYIVARVSGMPYEEYIQEHIFNPLGMAHSTVRSPLPPDLSAYASVGYTYQNGAFQAFPDYIAQPAGLPSGMHQVSVADMARFMIAHLQGGHYSDGTIAEARILKDTTARQMQSTLYTPDPRLLGTAYGWADWSDNGQRTLGHTGYGPPMRSVLLLLPDQNLGVFVTYNSKGNSELTRQHAGFQRAFFDHYYPAPAVAPIQPPADFGTRANRFVGSYRESSSPHTTLPKIMWLFGSVEISNSGDGTLLLEVGGLKRRFAEVEPLYFRQVDGPFQMVFREDANGRVTQMYTDYMPQYTTVKLDWYETPGFNMALLVGCVLIFLFSIPIAVIAFIWNRRQRGDRKPAPRGARIANWIILGICVVNLLVTVGLAWGAMGGISNELLDPPFVIKIVLGLGVLSAALTVGALVYCALAWKDHYWGIAARVYYTVVTVTALAFVWFLNNWNLLGWRY